jgi:hypothetical protein
MTRLKPYLLVMVEGDEGHRYIGQTMTFPLPEGTIMVRRVPGHAGTLIELPVSALKVLPNQERRRFVQYAKVSGHGSFPWDMLRRENAVPVNFDPETLEIDPAFKITVLLGDDARLIAKVTDGHTALWNYERWRSFGWEVEHIITERGIRFRSVEEIVEVARDNS